MQQRQEWQPCMRRDEFASKRPRPRDTPLQLLNKQNEALDPVWPELALKLNSSLPISACDCASNKFHPLLAFSIPFLSFPSPPSSPRLTRRGQYSLHSAHGVPQSSSLQGQTTITTLSSRPPAWTMLLRAPYGIPSRRRVCVESLPRRVRYPARQARPGCQARKGFAPLMNRITGFSSRCLLSRSALEGGIWTGRERHFTATTV